MISVAEPSLPRRLRRDARTYAANLLPARDTVGFCLLTNGKTGSTLLVDLLHSQPHIRCDGEVFSSWHDLPRLFVRGRTRAAGYRGLKAYGFKLNSMYLAERFLSAAPKGGVTPLLRHFADERFVFIHVRRRNLLRQALSVLRAAHRQEVHQTSGEASPYVGFVADIPALFSVMTSFERHDALLSVLDVGVNHTIFYEDDLERPERHQATVDAICAKLGLPAHPCRTALEKAGSVRLEDEMLNYDEVASVVGQTRFAHFLD